MKNSTVGCLLLVIAVLLSGCNYIDQDMEKTVPFAPESIVKSIDQNATGQTKIAPVEAEPAHPFTIIDTPEGRLIEGSVAVFVLNSAETVVALRTTKSQKTAKGILPGDIGGGEYIVYLRQPDGSEFEVGTFTVIAEPALPAEPMVTPASGAAGTPFTIYDPLGRIQVGSVAMFHMLGQDPATGINAEGIVVVDRWTLTGIAPGGCLGGRYLISVQSNIVAPPYFEDLVFDVD